jgi:hypothetical protein
MFESVAGGIIPTCVLAALAGIGLASLRIRWVALLVAVLTAIAVSYAWYWLPQLIWPAAHTDPQAGWGLVATIAWSVFAVPTAIVALLIVQKNRAAKAAAEA